MCEAPIFPMSPARFPPSSSVATDAHSHQEARAAQGAISFAHKAGEGVRWEVSPCRAQILNISIC
jgi:hypothetical protein